MDFEQSATFINALANLAWPAVALIALGFLLPILRRLSNSDELKIELGAGKISISGFGKNVSKQITDLQREVRKMQKRLDDEGKKTKANRAEAVVEARFDISNKPSLSLLWVDDDLEGIAVEKNQLKDQGWEIHEVTSTAAALEKLQTQNAEYDMIISDVGRRENGIYKRHAGIRLLANIRKAGKKQPVLFYTTMEKALSDDVQNAIKKYKDVYATGSTFEFFKIVSETEAAIRLGITP